MTSSFYDDDDFLGFFADASGNAVYNERATRNKNKRKKTKLPFPRFYR
jgi:hypothetical protein